MKINEETLNFIDIVDDLDDISKKLYLESPELWIDFSDKVGQKNLDEMVLFYAAKYNYVSIVKYAVDNKVINLDAPSKNNNYPSIREHILAVSNDYNSHNVYNYLSGKSEQTEQYDEEKDNNEYFPIFLCTHCNSNVLSSGYKVYEEVSFAFSQEKSTCDEVSRKRDTKVFCCNCNNVINDVTIDLLENICSIHNCKNCGKDLTQIGIDEKTNMKFNDNDKKFIATEKSFNCPSCHTKLNEYQEKYFNL